MLLFIVEIIIMIVAIMLGLRTAGALGCGIFAIVAQLIMIFGFQLPPVACNVPPAIPIARIIRTAVTGAEPGGS